jgi:allophanate hydrolase
LGIETIEIDFAPFLQAARLLYEGPWIAERYAAVGAFLEAHPGAFHPVTRQIIESGKSPTASAAFQGAYQLAELKRRSASAWSQVDFLLTPTAGTIYSLLDVEASPLKLNANLGFYTNFMNLFDLSGVAVPAGFRADGMPFGITFVGPRATEHALLELSGRFHRAAVATVGALESQLPPAAERSAAAKAPAAIAAPLPGGYQTVAVCGAHMQGLPLNHQLSERAGCLVATTRTAPHYRLFALPGGPPQRPGLIRVSEAGHAIELEVWALPAAAIGSFLAGIPAPLGLGKIELENGTWVTGFICEGYAALGATDISSFGGWRTYTQA